jgi:hypothetical protein
MVALQGALQKKNGRLMLRAKCASGSNRVAGRAANVLWPPLGRRGHPGAGGGIFRGGPLRQRLFSHLDAVMGPLHREG